MYQLQYTIKLDVKLDDLMKDLFNIIRDMDYMLHDKIIESIEGRFFRSKLFLFITYKEKKLKCINYF